MGRWVNFSDGPLAQDQGPEMSDPEKNAMIAFGLRCINSAMRAKTGRMRDGEAAYLLRCQRDYVPNDFSAKTAVSDFAAAVVSDPHYAGWALCQWLSDWEGGLVADRAILIEEKLSEQDPTWCYCGDVPAWPVPNEVSL
jgi:hypothetical protein